MSNGSRGPGNGRANADHSQPSDRDQGVLVAMRSGRKGAGDWMPLLVAIFPLAGVLDPWT